MKNLFVLLFTILFIFMFSNVRSQTDIGPDTRINVSGDYSALPSELKLRHVTDNNFNVPKDLVRRAAETSDNDERIKLGEKIDGFLNVTPSVPDKNAKPVSQIEPPFNPDWGIGDILVHSGNVAYSPGFRQMDMKQGEDGNMYLCVNRRNVSGYTASALVYKSTNGGRNWTLINGVQYASGAYIGQVSMLVEMRHATNPDSTRILLYYTVSTATNMDNAVLAMVSFRGNGSAWYQLNVYSPAAGNKYQYPSACSDGDYYDTATWMYCIVHEVTNANANVRLVHFRSTTWGQTHTVANINTTYDDFHPSASFCRKGSSDSIFIAVERRFSTTEYGLRLLTTPNTPSTAHYTYYLAYGLNSKYEKPCIAVRQQQAGIPRQILITSTKDSITKIARYHTSTNGGATWSINWALGFDYQISDFTWSSSDSLTAGGGYFIAGYVDLDGDSVSIRRGIIGSMGTVLYKRNSYQSTGYLPPVVVIYKVGSSKYSAFAYAGSGPNNVYYNQENLPAVGIEPTGTVPYQFALNQNYPNPFNPETKIVFDIPENVFVTLKVYDILGREVSNLVNENLKPGSYNITFDGAKLISGVYFYKITAGKFTGVRKMMLIK